MSTTLVPQTRGPDHPATSGEQPVLSCGIYTQGRLVFVILGGELDIATAPALARRMAPLIDTGSDLLLDLAGLQFCDCGGLSMFLRLRQRVISAGGSLHLTAPTAAVRRLIALTRLHDLLPIAVGQAEVITVLGCDAATVPPPRALDEIGIEHTQTGAVRTVSVAS